MRVPVREVDPEQPVGVSRCRDDAGVLGGGAGERLLAEDGEPARERPLRLLAVDLSYRFINGVAQLRDLVLSGELGDVFAADLVFHNAYGPDKAWFYDPALSGGGCVIDLGVHLVDLALWTLGFPRVVGVTSRLYAQGVPVLGDVERGRRDVAEDYAVARLDLETGASVELACSWRLSAGRDAVIGAAFYGTNGGAAFHNVNGSFYDFTVEHYRGTSRETLSAPPDDWGGRAAVDWAKRLAAGERFDVSAVHLVDVAEALDSIYEGREWGVGSRESRVLEASRGPVESPLPTAHSPAVR